MNYNDTKGTERLALTYFSTNQWGIMKVMLTRVSLNKGDLVGSFFIKKNLYRLSLVISCTSSIDTKMEKVGSMKAVSYRPERRNSQHL